MQREQNRRNKNNNDNQLKFVVCLHFFCFIVFISSNWINFLADRNSMEEKLLAYWLSFDSTSVDSMECVW